MLSRFQYNTGLYADNTILVLDANTEGHDFIIGDIHGNPKTLAALFTQQNRPLTQKDRVFFVGDLIDKGSDSLGTMKLFLRNPLSLKLYATRGNHEQEYLHTIKWLCEATELNEKIMHTFIRYVNCINTKKMTLRDAVNDFLKKGYSRSTRIIEMGSEWMISQFIQELLTEKITLTREYQPIFTKSSYIYRLYHTFESWPLMIIVNGNERSKPYRIVHADPPVSENILSRIIHNQRETPGFTLNELTHLLYCRPGSVSPEPDCLKKRTLFSNMRTYCGHNAYYTYRQKSYELTNEPIRDGNITNLDSSSYFSDIAIIAIHTLQKSIVLDYHTGDSTLLEDCSMQSNAINLSYSHEDNYFVSLELFQNITNGEALHNLLLNLRNDLFASNHHLCENYFELLRAIDYHSPISITQANALLSYLKNNAPMILNTSIKSLLTLKSFIGGENKNNLSVSQAGILSSNSLFTDTTLRNEKTSEINGLKVVST